MLFVTSAALQLAMAGAEENEGANPKTSPYTWGTIIGGIIGFSAMVIAEHFCGDVDNSPP
jgi:hypothetical protein